MTEVENHYNFCFDLVYRTELILRSFGVKNVSPDVMNPGKIQINLSTLEQTQFNVLWSFVELLTQNQFITIGDPYATHLDKPGNVTEIWRESFVVPMILEEFNRTTHSLSSDVWTVLPQWQSNMLRELFQQYKINVPFRAIP